MKNALTRAGAEPQQLLARCGCRRGHQSFQLTLRCLAKVQEGSFHSQGPLAPQSEEIGILRSFYNMPADGYSLRIGAFVACGQYEVVHSCWGPEQTRRANRVSGAR
eukprot:6488266-Amphidinium_carterae.1